MEKAKTRSAKKITDTVKKIVGIKGEKAAAKKPAAEKKSPGRRSHSHEEVSRRIQEKAHELYTNRGHAHGDDQADWYEAERIVMADLGRN